MHLHQNAKLPPEPLRGTGLLASHIDPTVDTETPKWVSSNIKDAYTQVAKDALDTSIIIQQDSDYDSESELMNTSSRGQHQQRCGERDVNPKTDICQSSNSA